MDIIETLYLSDQGGKIGQKSPHHSHGKDKRRNRHPPFCQQIHQITVRKQLRSKAQSQLLTSPQKILRMDLPVNAVHTANGVVIFAQEPVLHLIHTDIFAVASFHRVKVDIGCRLSMPAKLLMVLSMDGPRPFQQKSINSYRNDQHQH